MLLTEYRPFQVDKMLVEQSINENKPLVVKGVIQRAESKNQNGRIYPKDILLREIQKYVEGKGYSVVKDFCGHGISNTFHESPNILHYGKKNTGLEIYPGMTFTIEPMINFGKYDVKILDDGWTAVSKDKSLSAQFEHTVGIKDNGYEIFTESDKGYVKPPYN